MRPGAGALRDVVRDLIGTRDGATYFAERVWGVGRRCELGGRHPLAGRSAPDFELDGIRLGVLLRTGAGVLLDFDGRAVLRTIGDHLQGRIRYVEGAPKNRLGLGALLVRPDGVVAWACDNEPDVDELVAALSRWAEPRAMTKLQAALKRRH